MTTRRIVITMLLALAEAAVLAPLVFILVPAPRGLTLTLQIGSVWVIVFGLTLQWQWLAQRGVALQTQRLVMGFWLIVLIALFEADVFTLTPTMQPDLLTMAPAFGIAILLWWRGMNLGNDELHPRTAELHLQAGMLLLILTSFATLFIRNDEVFIPIIAFFIGALGAVPLCNLEMTAHSSSGRPVPMTRGWWGWIVLSVLGVLLIGLLVSSLITGRSAAEILALLIGVILLPIILILSIIPVTVLDALVEFLRRLTAGFGQLAMFGQGIQQLPQNEKHCAAHHSAAGVQSCVCVDRAGRRGTAGDLADAARRQAIVCVTGDERRHRRRTVGEARCGCRRDQPCVGTRHCGAGWRR